VKFAILVNAAPYSQQGSLTAYHFSRAVLNKGHRIHRIFFYRDGVLNANSFISPPSDEFNLVTAWQELAEKEGVELMVCVTAALRRGVIDSVEAKQRDGGAGNLARGFKLTGLGQLMEAVLITDRFVVFN
jgi:tRNA 2-thiouridine synthesizing protein D